MIRNKNPVYAGNHDGNRKVLGRRARSLAGWPTYGAFVYMALGTLAVVRFALHLIVVVV